MQKNTLLAYNLTTGKKYGCNEMINKTIQVVTGYKKTTYNPVTTAYNFKGVTTGFQIVNNIDSS